MKCIHVADLHLGTDISSLGHLGRSRTAELLSTFKNIIRVCNEEEVRYLLIAGDLFDCAVPDRPLLEAAAGAFADIADTRVIIAPGNHDYASYGSCYMDGKIWSDNVYIFRNQWENICFDDDRVQIYGAAFTSAYQNTPLMPMNNYGLKPGYIHIGVLHGEIVTEGGISRYNPITEKMIKNSGLDYLALGHTHTAKLKKCGNTVYVYSGCPEGRGFDESGAKGIYMGDIMSGECDMQFLEMSRREFREVVVNLDGVNVEHEILNMVENTLRQLGDDYAEHLYRIYLTGTVDEHIRINTEEIAACLNVYYAKIEDETRLRIDYEQMASEQNMLGIYTRKMLAGIHECEERGDIQKAQLYMEALEMAYRVRNED